MFSSYNIKKWIILKIIIEGIDLNPMEIEILEKEMEMGIKLMENLITA